MTTTEITMTTQTVTGPAKLLLRAISNAVMFASTDTTLPVLCTVHFRMIDGTLVAEATDRHVASQELVGTAIGALEDVCLDAKSAHRAVKDFGRVLRHPANRDLAGKAQLRIDTTSGSGIADFTLTGLGEDETRPVIAPELINTWPARSVDRLWAKNGKRLAKLDGSAWNRRHVYRAALLAKLASVDDGQNPAVRNLAFQFTTTGSQVAVTIGDAFRALLMPVGNA